MSMSSRVNPSQCRAESTRANVKLSWASPMLNRVGSGPCQADLARANVEPQDDVEPSWFRPMSSRVGPGPFIVQSTRVDVEPARMYDFKLEGGEWFKKGFRKLFEME